MMYVCGTGFCFCGKVPKNVSNLSLREATISTPLHSCQVARPRLDLSIRCSQQTRGIKVWHDANVRCVSMHAAFRKPLWNHRDQTSLRSVTWLWLWLYTYIYTILPPASKTLANFICAHIYTHTNTYTFT